MLTPVSCPSISCLMILKFIYLFIHLFSVTLSFLLASGHNVWLKDRTGSLMDTSVVVEIKPTKPFPKQQITLSPCLIISPTQVYYLLNC